MWSFAAGVVDASGLPKVLLKAPHKGNPIRPHKVTTYGHKIQRQCLPFIMPVHIADGSGRASTGRCGFGAARTRAGMSGA